MLSVVMPLYNKGPYVERALGSLLHQTDSDLDVVIVDDGSSDDGPERVRAIEDPRVRLIQQPNAGAGAARNRGIAEARSEWVGFLDADDEWLPSYADAVRRAADAHPEAVLYFGDLEEPGGGRRLREALPEGYVDDYFALYLHNGRSPVVTSGVTARKEALDRVGGFSHHRVGQDVDLWTRLALVGRFYHLGGVHGIYYPAIPGSNMNRKDGFKRIYPGAAETLEAKFAAGEVPERLRASAEAFRRFLLTQYGYTLMRAGDGREARRVLREAGAQGRARKLIWATYLPSAMRDRYFATRDSG